MPNIPSPNTVYNRARLKIPVPCQNCTVRKGGCHATCMQYIAYQKTLRDLKTKIYAEYYHERNTSEFTIERVLATKRKPY